MIFSVIVPVYNTGDSDLLVTGVSFTGTNGSAFSTVSTLPVSIGPFIEGQIEIDLVLPGDRPFLGPDRVSGTERALRP